MEYSFCVLSAVQAREFEEKCTTPNCEHHRHCTAKDIVKLEAGNHPKYPHREFRWVGDKYRMITMLPPMILRPRDGVVCLVRGVIQGHSTGVRSQFSMVRGKGSRYPVGMNGARDRRQAVRSINHVPPAELQANA